MRGIGVVGGKSFYGVFVLNRRIDLHAIDATPARWRGGAGSSPLDRARTAASSPVLRVGCTRRRRVDFTQVTSRFYAGFGWSKAST